MSDRDAGKPMPAARWSMGGTVSSNYHARPQPLWAKPMNSQPARLELAREIMARCAIARAAETGTFMGTTTALFVQFGVPIVTSEINPEYAARALERLRHLPNVDLRRADSIAVLREFAGAPIDRSVPTLFYLDAHWHEHLPLREEIELAVDNFANAVLMIDDFAVPDDPGYGFDDYGRGKRLDLDYLLAANVPPLAVYFPSTPSDREQGGRRGCVVATADAGLAVVLDGIALLRRWKT